MIFGPSPAGPGTDSSFSVPVPWVPRKMGPVPSRPGTGPWDASRPARSQFFWIHILLFVYIYIDQNTFVLNGFSKLEFRVPRTKYRLHLAVSRPIRSQVFEDIPKILSKFDTLRILVATVQASLLLESKETMSDIPILIKNYRFLEYC